MAKSKIHPAGSQQPLATTFIIGQGLGQDRYVAVRYLRLLENDHIIVGLRVFQERYTIIYPPKSMHQSTLLSNSEVRGHWKALSMRLSPPQNEGRPHTIWGFTRWYEPCTLVRKLWLGHGHFDIDFSIGVNHGFTNPQLQFMTGVPTPMIIDHYFRR